MTTGADHYRPYEGLWPARALVRGPALIVAPHPDDEIIGCGGNLVAHREAGAEVAVAVLTDGALGDPGGTRSAAYCEARQKETRAALAIAGGGEAHFLGHPDGGLREAHGAVAQLAALIERLAPATLFFPSPYEVHPDHRAAALHTLRAVRTLARPPRLFAYEIGAMMPANVLADVTPYMERKERAIAAYHSQLLHQDLVAKVRAANRARTVNVDDPAVTYAEALIHLNPTSVAGFLDAVDAVLRITDAMPPG